MDSLGFPGLPSTLAQIRFLSFTISKIAREVAGHLAAVRRTAVPVSETHFCARPAHCRATCSQWLLESSLRNSVPAWSIASVRVCAVTVETTARPLAAVLSSPRGPPQMGHGICPPAS